MKPKQFKSLNHKVLTYIAWSALVLLLIAALASFIIQYKRSKLNTVSMLNQLLDTVEDTVTVAAYSKNQQIAEDVIKGLLKNDIVHKVIIMSDKGFSLEQSKNNDLNTIDPVSRSIYSLFDSGEIIGYIKIQASAQYSLIEAKYTTLSNVLSSFVLIGMTALVIVWVMQKFISRPLTFVSNTLHDIETGKKQRIPALVNNMDDELGRLRTDINTLLSTLDDKFNSEYELRQNIEYMEQALRHKYNSSSAGLFSLDMDGILLTSNSTLKRILHFIDNENFQNEQRHQFSKFMKDHNRFVLLLDKAIESGELESEDFLLTEQETLAATWVHCLIAPITASNGQISFEGVLFDVTSRVKTEIATQYEAKHDSLTGLLNRQATQTVFENSPNTQQNYFLMMDLDGFKKANDTYGHSTGDKVLKITSDRLLRCVRSSDIVSRFGGDEFLVILFDCQPQNRAFEIAEKIITSIQKPMRIDKNITVNVSISVGAADSMLDNKNDFESMIKKADDAMYVVKRHGKNGYCIKNINGEMRPKFFGTDF